MDRALFFLLLALSLIPSLSSKGTLAISSSGIRLFVLLSLHTFLVNFVYCISIYNQSASHILITLL